MGNPVGPRKDSSINSFLSQLELIKQEDVSASAMFLDSQQPVQSDSRLNAELLLLVDDALKGGDPNFLKHVSKNQRQQQYQSIPLKDYTLTNKIQLNNSKQTSPRSILPIEQSPPLEPVIQQTERQQPKFVPFILDSTIQQQVESNREITESTIYHNHQHQLQVKKHQRFMNTNKHLKFYQQMKHHLYEESHSIQQQELPSQLFSDTASSTLYSVAAPFHNLQVTSRKIEDLNSLQDYFRSVSTRGGAFMKRLYKVKQQQGKKENIQQPESINSFEENQRDMIHIPGFNPHPVFNASCNLSKKKENSMTAKRIYSKAHQSPQKKVNCFEQQYHQIEEYTSRLSKGLGKARNSPGLEIQKYSAYKALHQPFTESTTNPLDYESSIAELNQTAIKFANDYKSRDFAHAIESTENESIPVRPASIFQHPVKPQHDQSKIDKNKDLDDVKTPLMRKFHRNKLASLDGEIDRIKKRAGILVSNPAQTALPSPRKKTNYKFLPSQSVSETSPRQLLARVVTQVPMTRTTNDKHSVNTFVNKLNSLPQQHPPSEQVASYRRVSSQCEPTINSGISPPVVRRQVVTKVLNGEIILDAMPRRDANFINHQLLSMKYEMELQRLRKQKARGQHKILDLANNAAVQIFIPGQENLNATRGTTKQSWFR